MTASAPTFPANDYTELKTLRAEQRAGVLRIELDNDPDSGNLVSEQMLDDLLAILGGQDPRTRVLVLAAAGPDFCLGGDRTESDELLADGIRASGDKALRVCKALTGNRAVTIARVQGKVIGAGVALALACDLRVGADDATFRLPELTLGLPLAWGGLLPRLLNEAGAARIREIALTSRTFDAPEALELSILQKMVPEGELDAAVMGWAKPLLRRRAAGLRVTKALFNAHGAANSLGDLSALDPELMAAAWSDTIAEAAAAKQTRRVP